MQNETIDFYKQYCKDIDKYKFLTEEEEKELARKALNGDKLAREKILNAHLKMVVGIARNYIGQGLDIMDLIQEGNIGLTKAVDKFNPEKGFRFSTYSAWWVKQAITRAIANTGRTIRLPVYMTENIYKYKKAVNELSYKLGRTPSSEELAEYMGISLKDIKHIEKNSFDTSSLDVALNAENDTLSNLIPDENSLAVHEKIDSIFTEKTTRMLLQNLTDKEKNVLILHYGLMNHKSHTYEEIGELLNLTKERIRQIERSALNKIKIKAQKNDKFAI